MAIRYASIALMHGAFRVGEWLVEPSLNRISRGDTKIQLELRVMDVLVCLAERAGEMVTRKEIIDRVWATEFIADNTLTKAITEIRNALGDDARNPSYIETIHRRGYRLIAPFNNSDIPEAISPGVVPYPFPGERERSRAENGPFPGLAVFSEKEARFFFGRETETAQLWRKLTSRRLLALIGPSGVGKSSLLHAGVIATKPEGWSAVVCHPGEAPFAALARALVPELEGDKDAVSKLIELRELGEMVAVVSRWRDRHDQVLLIVDQFEELFTLNSEEMQGRFAQLLRRLADEADVHVLVALRDDFLCRCHPHATLRPVFSDMTVLDQPDADALRRAIVEPAQHFGFTFIDTDMPKEMVAEVEGERGALPMIAFALARLWEKRDRTRKLLTRTAYEDIGGVSGALARHADATLTAIGEEHQPIVREIFRNLVSGAGTRSVRDVDDLLSVFPEPKRSDARAVLLRLIDARLLTSFEDDAIPGGEKSRRVELVHESLLTSWPRLVRWQTQDVEAAGLRDQLRHAAHHWDEHGRTDDCLWTGQLYREFVTWQANYPGGLSKLESEFAAAMTAFANRRTRLFRLVCTAALVATVTLAAVFGTLWRRSIFETHRAEAQELLALGALELEANPTAALAWARASIDASDTMKGRLFALRALDKGPTGRFQCMKSPLGYVHSTVFSPGGEWAVFGGWEKLKISRRSGGPPIQVDAFPTDGWKAIWPFFETSGGRFGALQSGVIRTYTTPNHSEVSRFPLNPQSRWAPVPTDRGILVISRVGDHDTIDLWQFDSPRETLAVIPQTLAGDAAANGEWFFFVPREEDNKVYRQSLIDPALSPELVHSHDEPVSDVLLHPELEWIALRGRESNRITVWPLLGQPHEPFRSFDGRNLTRLAVDPQGQRIVAAGKSDNSATALVFDLRLPSGAEPLEIQTTLAQGKVSGLTIDPSGRWVVVGNLYSASFWPLSEIPRIVFPGDGESVMALAFTPDGNKLVIPSRSSSCGLRLQPLGAETEPMQRLGAQGLNDMELDPEGRFAVVSEILTPVISIFPLDGSEPTRLEGLDPSSANLSVAYDSRRGLVAAGPSRGPRDQKIIRVWSLRDGSFQTLGPTDDAGDGFSGGYSELDFLPDGDLLSSGRGGVRRWSLETRSSTLLLPESCRIGSVAPDGSSAIVRCFDEDDRGKVSILDLNTSAMRPLNGFRGTISATAYSPEGDVVAIGMADGTVQLAGLSGGEPHVLSSHEVPVTSLVFSPDGRRIASADQGGTVRVSPVPDLSKAPLHILAHDELIAKLDSFTNLRVVRDTGSADGWKLEVGPFPGWETVPER